MNTPNGKNVDIEQARAFLRKHLDLASPPAVEYVGEGAWSRCFGFQRDDEDLVIRFGKHVDDFQKDQRAHTHAAPGLPIPAVLEIGEAYGEYYCISSRVRGGPLEEVSGETWLTLIPAIVDMLEGLRLADLSATSGFGGWERDGQAPQASWSDHLLKVGIDHPDLRVHGWRAKLAAAPEAEAAFEWGWQLLKEIVSDDIPRGLVHGDLMNKNVFVRDGRISGVFDWGCSLYGDHLYELALIEFWAPWYPELDIRSLRHELELRWQVVGYHPQNLTNRLNACYLHIGLDHLAYHSYLENWDHLLELVERMKTLVG